jgi:Tol biopolymer transport system component
VPESWSPDGRYISYSVLKESEYSLWILSLGDCKTARFSDVRSREPIGSVFSPDGRWIDFQPLWSRDSTELFDVATTSSGLKAVPMKITSGVTFGSPQGIPFSWHNRAPRLLTNSR